MYIVSWVSFMYMYTVVMCMLVIVAPPIVVGAWSMAFLLRQHVEYYYYYQRFVMQSEFNYKLLCCNDQTFF